MSTPINVRGETYNMTVVKDSAVWPEQGGWRAWFGRSIEGVGLTLPDLKDKGAKDLNELREMLGQVGIVVANLVEG